MSGLEVKIKGLDLSREYYENMGKSILMELFPEYMGKAAVGLVGEGSECFGFDDQISMDHDYGPSFCVWLPRNIYTRARESMTEIYESLPKEYKGISANIIREQSAGRRGILEIEGFYQKFLTRDTIPESSLDWLRIPEHFYAVATNGEVFEDNLGMFTDVRRKLLDYYPEDVRLKKIAACAVRMAHSGQCNYARMMWRRDIVAAKFALDEFMRNTIAIVFLLNRVYCPYYKWMWRGLEQLPKLGRVRELLKIMAAGVLDESHWDSSKWKACRYKLNRADQMVDMVEQIADLIREELWRQGISSSTSDYLEEHGYAVMSCIQDQRIRSLPVLVG
ncbi:DUF4037 domain-containing protein [Clostridium sp. D5]|uniref:DUF4037 domain-containing protein n=1 Tax=Clostridium sp. D5 TaxID=556261 RepID=UPI0012F50201|nr:DUF4037 domain-containing protein [Clostridium sp. D5]